MSAPGSFTIVPSGPFSLEAAAGFGFGGRLGAPEFDGTMRLAFAVDGHTELAGVILREDRAGIHGEVYGAHDVSAVREQVARILSLDHDGDAWQAVGHRDPVIGELQNGHPGLRPVLFHSPYEAAAWSVISARVAGRQAARVRQQISESLGETFDLDGQRMSAFPLPEQLAKLEAVPGLPPVKVERLRGIATAALEGRLDPGRLQAMGPEGATDEMLGLKGIGPFYAAPHRHPRHRVRGHPGAWGASPTRIYRPSLRPGREPHPGCTARACRALAPVSDVGDRAHPGRRRPGGHPPRGQGSVGPARPHASRPPGEKQRAGREVVSSGVPFFGHKTRHEREWEEVRATAQDDLVALGDDIRTLDVDIAMPGVTEDAKERYEQALEAYKRASQIFDRANDPRTWLR